MPKLLIKYFATGYQAWLQEYFYLDENQLARRAPQGIKRLIFDYILRNLQLKWKSSGIFEAEVPDEVHRFFELLLSHRGRTGLKKKEVEAFLAGKPSVKEVIEKYSPHFLMLRLRQKDLEVEKWSESLS